jgi:hypothetical protein
VVSNEIPEPVEALAEEMAILAAVLDHPGDVVRA